jgi:hypothetical protein
MKKLKNRGDEMEFENKKKLTLMHEITRIEEKKSVSTALEFLIVKKCLPICFISIEL